MSSTSESRPRQPMTVPRLLEMKQMGQKITMLTAYDATFAHHLDEAGVDLILVGDSLGMVVQGHSSTLPVTADHVVYHSAAVSRSVHSSLVIADLPFRSVLSVESAVEAAARFLVEGHASMVKLEGGSPLALSTIRALVERSIPVCAHLGLTPQSVHALGGYRVQGKGEEAAERIRQAAAAVEAAGASLLVLECVPEKLAKQITTTSRIPTVGIGAGGFCDGQVLVIHDILGVTVGKRPKFVKNFLAGRDSVRSAIDSFVHAVRTGEFPDHEHTFH